MFTVELSFERTLSGLEHLTLLKKFNLTSSDRLYPDTSLTVNVSEYFALRYPQYFDTKFSHSIQLNNKFIDNLPYLAFYKVQSNLNNHQWHLFLSETFWNEETLVEYLPSFKVNKPWWKRIFNV